MFLFGFYGIKAQYVDSTFMQLSSEQAIDSLLSLHKSFNEKYINIDGYRIQIFKGSGNSALENAELLIEEFSEKFNEIPTYISFQEPYYRVRAGNFRTRLDALNSMRLIKSDYPSAFVIQDKIEFVVLPKYNKSVSYEQEDSSRD